MGAAQRRLEIATANLANASTDGFARQRAVGSLDARGVHIHSVTDLRAGALRRTGRAFDLASIGGSLHLRDAAGVQSTVRSARLIRDRFGALRDSSGRVLLDISNRPLRVPLGARFYSDGTLRTNGGICGRIALAPHATLQTGFVESANVNAISEMLDVLTAQRSFEGAQRVITRIEATRKKATDDVAAMD